ncbi:MAG: hypothetical protein R3E21_08355 [Caenibius sp.]
MASHNTGGAQALPTALLAQAIPMLTRHDLEALTERLIDVLDSMDGDCDIEDDDPREDDNSDYCLASEDRGTGGCRNAIFSGYFSQKELDSDENCERNWQPAEMR